MPARPAMVAARQQTGAGRIGLLGPVMAMLLTAIGVVLLHDAIAAADTRPGRTWLAAVLDGADRATAEWWMIPAGVGIALLGVWMIITALRPRSRKTLAVTSQTGVFLRTRDVARLASAAADDVDGVLSASSVASRRTVMVTVESDREGVAELVRDTVGRRLSALVSPPKVKVRVRAHWQIRKEV
ncbi:DUF6286 domain-containing protein [Micromonosporaceae bacterium Da 78-11]